MIFQLLFTIILVALGIAYLWKQFGYKPPANATSEESTKNNKNKKKKAEVQKEEKHQKQQPSTKLSMKQLKKEFEQEAKRKNKLKAKNPTHKTFINAFKGFASNITCYDIDHNIIVIGSQDKTFKLFSISQLLENKNQELTFVKYNIDFNYPTAISVNKQSKLIACALNNEKTVELYQYKKADSKSIKDTNKKIVNQFVIEKVRKFKEKLYIDDIIGIAISANSQFIITVANDSQTYIKVFNIYGDELYKYNTNQVKHFCSEINYNREFIITGTWQADIKILKTKQDKSGTFQSFTKAMILGGHKTKVKYISCSQNSEKALTISDDKTVIIWDLNVRYEQSEDPKKHLIIDMNNNEFIEGNEAITAGAVHSNIIHGKQIVIAALGYSNNIVLIDVLNSKITAKIPEATFEGSYIQSLRFHHLDQKCSLLALGYDSNRINVFNIDEDAL